MDPEWFTPLLSVQTRGEAPCDQDDEKQGLHTPTLPCLSEFLQRREEKQLRVSSYESYRFGFKMDDPAFGGVPRPGG